MTNIIRLVDDGGSTYIADYKWETYRFLLSNGNTIDVKAIQDNSVVREAVLKLANKVDKIPDRGPNQLGIIISGSCTLPEPVEEKTVPKKRPAKRAGRARAAALEEQSA